MPALPSNSSAIARLLIALAGGYALVRLLADLIQKKADDSLSLLSDATGFANGVLLLLAAAYQDVVLKALGDTTPYLVFAGLAAIFSAVSALKKPRGRRSGG